MWGLFAQSEAFVINNISTLLVSPTAPNGDNTFTVDTATVAYHSTAGNIDISFNAEVFQYLGAGEHLDLGTFTYLTFLSKVLNTAEVHIVIDGANDVAEFSGDADRNVSEDSTLLVNGDLDVIDKDHDQSVFHHTSALVGTYGNFSFDLDSGEWDFSLRNNDANVQALSSLDNPVDTLTVYSTDGTSEGHQRHRQRCR